MSDDTCYYTFTVKVSGSGDTLLEAWENAREKIARLHWEDIHAFQMDGCDEYPESMMDF